MSILQTTDLKKYYGRGPNITKALDGDMVDKKVRANENTATTRNTGEARF